MNLDIFTAMKMKINLIEHEATATKLDGISGRVLQEEIKSEITPYLGLKTPFFIDWATFVRQRLLSESEIKLMSDPTIRLSCKFPDCKMAGYKMDYMWKFERIYMY